jgi:hypothetical protein
MSGVDQTRPSGRDRFCLEDMTAMLTPGQRLFVHLVRALKDCTRRRTQDGTF